MAIKKIHQSEVARHMMINTGRGALVLLCAFSACDPENHYREHPEIAYSD